MNKLFIFCMLLLPSVSYSYPQFIGYGYTSCLTCHYNGQGSGQLNDYGRALWATEIAGRAFSSGLSEEQLGEISGFLGKKQLPFWLRLGAKFRQLWIENNPARSTSQSNSILMQADMNVSFFTNPGQTLGLISTIGFADENLQRLNQVTGRGDSSLISREHYVRWMANPRLWLYAGKMDKIYGIRHANHSAFSRRSVGINQNDQVHGLALQYIQSNWELTGHLFAGDLTRDEEFRDVGASLMFEKDIKKLWRVGLSALTSKNDFFNRNMLGLHSKRGLGYGLAFINEFGVISTKNNQSDESQFGYYTYNEMIQRLVRGYHVFTTLQSYKNDLTASSSDIIRFGFGFLVFPMQRLELRIDVENAQVLTSGSEVNDDDWAFLGQIHLSL